jgi:zinc-binding alcohol dehydrogenase family protein
MRAVGYRRPLPITEQEALIDVELPRPEAQGRDLLVQVKAVSVNPVDTKVRKRAAPEEGQVKVLGYDAAGVVMATGPEVTLFKPGDEVYYAGSILRQGTNAEYHLVDERIVGHKPTSLGFAQAAALPLTTITAYEALFERLEVGRPVAGGAPLILIVGAAGGVGSMAVQLARRLSDLTIIGTASRPETQAWVRDLGAHHVIDHSKPMAAQVEALGLGAPSFVFSITQTDQHLEDLAQLILPQGRFSLIDDPVSFDATKFKGKSVSINWESMFTRSTFQTADMQKQHDLLNEVARLVDKGSIRTTASESYGWINAENLRKAHGFIESGQAKGKVVLEGF